MNADGKTDKLPEGTYQVLALADGLVDGYPMVQIEHAGKTVYAAVLDDRCRLADTPDEGLDLHLCRCPTKATGATSEPTARDLAFRQSLSGKEDEYE